MRLISYIALSDSPPPNYFAPSLTGDINAQSFHWNNGKMKIAHDSAYVQIKTFSFTFDEQAFIVYFYLCSNFQDIAVPNAKLYKLINIQADYFCQQRRTVH